MGGFVWGFFPFFFTSGELLIYGYIVCVHSIGKCGRKGSHFSVKNKF